MQVNITAQTISVYTTEKAKKEVFLAVKTAEM